MAIVQMNPAAVGKLVDEVSVEVATDRLSRRLAGDGLTFEERAVAEQLATALLKDAAETVRRNFAETLKTSTKLPRSLALALARDVDSVALPILQFSQSLSDTDLIAIIEAGSSRKQVAIAKRSAVSARVADALVGTDNPEAVSTLLSNEGAQISAQSLEKAAIRFGFSEQVARSLRKRPRLPLAIAERLVTFTLDSLGDYIKSRPHLPTEIVNQLVLRTREEATLNLRSGHFPAEEAEILVRHLKAADRLSPSLIIRAVCMGDLAFFESAIAMRANIPVHNARKLIHDHGQLGLNSLYAAAKMPPAQLTVARTALDFILEMQTQGAETNLEHYRQSMIERMLSRTEDKQADDLEPADLNYLIMRLGDLQTTALAA